LKLEFTYTETRWRWLVAGLRGWILNLKNGAWRFMLILLEDQLEKAAKLICKPTKYATWFWQFRRRQQEYGSNNEVFCTRI